MEQRPTIDWTEHDFHPIVPSFPARDEVGVLDLTGNIEDSTEEQHQKFTSPYSIGKYDENRNIYQSDLFSDGRSLHVGLGNMKDVCHCFTLVRALF